MRLITLRFKRLMIYLLINIGYTGMTDITTAPDSLCMPVPEKRSSCVTSPFR